MIKKNVAFNLFRYSLVLLRQFVKALAESRQRRTLLVSEVDSVLTDFGFDVRLGLAVAEPVLHAQRHLRGSLQDVDHYARGRASAAPHQLACATNLNTSHGIFSLEK